MTSLKQLSFEFMREICPPPTTNGQLDFLLLAWLEDFRFVCRNPTDILFPTLQMHLPWGARAPHLRTFEYTYADPFNPGQLSRYILSESGRMVASRFTQYNVNPTDGNTVSLLPQLHHLSTYFRSLTSLNLGSIMPDTFIHLRSLANLDYLISLKLNFTLYPTTFPDDLKCIKPTYSEHTKKLASEVCLSSVLILECDVSALDRHKDLHHFPTIQETFPQLQVLIVHAWPDQLRKCAQCRVEEQPSIMCQLAVCLRMNAWNEQLKRVMFNGAHW